MSAGRRWADEYRRAWLAGDAEAAGALYAENCIYRSHPFRELEDAREYARWAYADASAREVWFGEPIADGDRAVVEYWAILVAPSGEEMTLAGCSVLRFGPDGLVVDARDYWHEQPGRRAPPAEWHG